MWPSGLRRQLTKRWVADSIPAGDLYFHFEDIDWFLSSQLGEANWNEIKHDFHPEQKVQRDSYNIKNMAAGCLITGQLLRARSFIWLILCCIIIQWKHMFIFWTMHVLENYTSMMTWTTLIKICFISITVNRENVKPAFCPSRPKIDGEFKTGQIELFVNGLCKKIREGDFKGKCISLGCL